MPHLNEATTSWLRSHHGIISAARLEKLGISRWVRQHQVDKGVLIPVHKGVYRVVTQPVTLESRCAALCAFQPTGFVTGPTAGVLHGLRRMPLQRSTTRGLDATVIHFCAPHGKFRALGGIQMRQSTLIERTDVQRRNDGIRIAAPWRLAFDLAADLVPEDLESVIEQILEKRLCTFTTLASTARRLGRAARPGSAAFVAALSSRLPGGPIESHPELVLAKALRAAGVPIVVQATWLDLPNGRRIRLDISVPDIRWGLEVDVHPDHFLQQGTADRRRDRQCHLIGWQVDRVTGIDLLDMSHLIPELVGLYRGRIAELSKRDR
jgi:hypothetical protein